MSSDSRRPERAGTLVSAERSSAAMATAATAFLTSLNAAQKGRRLPFEGEERLRWHFIPTEMFPRKGLTIKEMTEPQRKAAHDLLKTGLSQRGYMTATAIMELENILGAIEAARRQGGAAASSRSAAIPNVLLLNLRHAVDSGTWGWRVEGHHVSLQFTVVKGTLVAASPSFFGSNPAEVRDGPRKGLRILGAEEDAARALLSALDATQRTKAIMTAVAPTDILTMAKSDIEPLAAAGIGADALNPAQRDLLMKLVDVYAGYMAPDIAEDRLSRLKKAGVEKISFAWAGPVERGQKHYYRVQGPTFLIEYDNTQDDPQGRRVVLLDKPLFTIGRRTAADLQIVSTDVSREHAEVARDGDRYLLRDRGSRYGTFVKRQSGHRVSAVPRRPRPPRPYRCRRAGVLRR